MKLWRRMCTAADGETVVVGGRDWTRFYLFLAETLGILGVCTFAVAVLGAGVGFVWLLQHWTVTVVLVLTMTLVSLLSWWLWPEWLEPEVQA